MQAYILQRCPSLELRSLKDQRWIRFLKLDDGSRGTEHDSIIPLYVSLIYLNINTTTRPGELTTFQRTRDADVSIALADTIVYHRVAETPPLSKSVFYTYLTTC
jgi:hypothetical protein